MNKNLLGTVSRHGFDSQFKAPEATQFLPILPRYDEQHILYAAKNPEQIFSPLVALPPIQIQSGVGHPLDRMPRNKTDPTMVRYLDELGDLTKSITCDGNVCQSSWMQEIGIPNTITLLKSAVSGFGK